jgi:hypothetical protein
MKMISLLASIVFLLILITSHIRCQSNVKSISKVFQTRYRLLVADNLNHKLLKSMGTPRCGVGNDPLFYKVGNRW